MFGGKQAHQADVGAVVDWLATHGQVGDLLLVGGQDWISRIIQRLTESPFSHALVITGPDTLIEAYDYRLTVSENDEGVYEISFLAFAEREHSLARLNIYRLPEGTLDMCRLHSTAELLRDTAPTYPTLAAIVFLLAQLTGRVARAAENGRRRWLMPSRKHIGVQARFWGDGPRRVHCAELATRLYCAAGAEIEFKSPLLSPYIDAVEGQGTYLARDLQAPEGPGGGPVQAPAPAEPAPLSLNFVSNMLAPFAGAISVFNSIANRALCRAEPDIADYILPNDFANADPFRKVASLTLNRRGVGEAAQPLHN